MNLYKSDQEIFDQYAEAATELIMRQYALAMGEAVPESSPEQKISRALDEKCRKQIRKGLRKQQLRVAAKMVLRYTKRIAMFVLMLFGVAGILFTSVEAIRTPIINFFMEQKAGYLEITGTEESPVGGNSSAKNPLDGLLSADYAPVILEKSRTGGILAMYETAEGAYIIFSAIPHTGVINVDSENANIEHIAILSHDGMLIEKNERQLLWVNRETGRMCRLETNTLSREEIIALAENIEKNQSFS